jgi:hypothetical protein
MRGALPALGASSLAGWAKALAAVLEIARAETWTGRADVEGNDRSRLDVRIILVVVSDSRW